VLGHYACSHGIGLLKKGGWKLAEGNARIDGERERERREGQWKQILGGYITANVDQTRGMTYYCAIF
jgi:hypothetical protein